MWAEPRKTSNFNSRGINANQTKVLKEAKILVPVRPHCEPKLNFTASSVSLGAGWYLHCMTALATAAASIGWPPRILTFFTVPSAFTSACTCTVPVNFSRAAMAGYYGGTLRSRRLPVSTVEGESVATAGGAP